MNKRGVKAGRLFGISIYIDYSWIIIFGLIVWLLSTGYYPVKYGFDSESSILLAIITAILFFASALLHELMHSIVAIKNGIKVKRIILYLFGGLAELFEEPKNADSEFKIAIAGPTTSMALALLFLAFWEIFDSLVKIPEISALWSTLFQVNLMLAIFNLLPGFPLDGGRILRSIVWASSGDIMSATKIATMSGKAVAFFIVFFGIFMIVISGFWGGLWLVLIGLFLNQAATQSYLELQIKNSLENKTVGDFKQSTLLINPKLSINEALTEYFSTNNQTVFPVANEHRILGILALDDIRKNQNELTEFNRVEDIMRRFPNVYLKPGDKALKALKLMTVSQLSFLPIKENKKIVGIITLDRLALYLSEEKII